MVTFANIIFRRPNDLIDRLKQFGADVDCVSSTARPPVTIRASLRYGNTLLRPITIKYVAIQHLKGLPPLPDTSDPYELQGFTIHNPPKDADHIRRAIFVSGDYSPRHGTRYGSETTRQFWEKRKRYDEYQHREEEG